MYAQQGSLVGKTMEILDEDISGICVRNDIHYPFLTIFRLKDFRYLLASECRYKMRDYKMEHIESIDNYQKGFEIPT